MEPRSLKFNSQSCREAVICMERFGFARICVEISAESELVEEVDLEYCNGFTITQRLEYELVPKCCSKCKCFGHDNNGCTTKSVYVAKEQNDKPPSSNGAGKEIPEVAKDDKQTEEGEGEGEGAGVEELLVCNDGLPCGVMVSEQGVVSARTDEEWTLVRRKKVAEVARKAAQEAELQNKTTPPVTPGPPRPPGSTGVNSVNHRQTQQRAGKKGRGRPKRNK